MTGEPFPLENLSFGKFEVYEVGAGLVTLIAYSEPSDTDERRREVHRSLCALAIRLWGQREENPGPFPFQIKSMYAHRSTSALNQEYQHVMRRGNNRMIAARAAIGFLKEAETGEVPPLPDGIKRLTINQMCDLVFPQSNESDPGNFETRIWRQSRSVIHLAAAVQVLLQMFEFQFGMPINFLDLILNRSLIQWVVAEAERYEGLIAKAPRMHVDEKTLIRVRLAT